MNKQEHLPLYPGSNNLPKVLPDQQQPATPITPQQKLALGPKNCTVSCTQCRASIRTTIEHTVTTRTHMTAALCHFLCCCCCVPYCLDSARNADHYCPNCKAYLGTYEK